MHGRRARLRFRVRLRIFGKMADIVNNPNTTNAAFFEFSLLRKQFSRTIAVHNSSTLVCRGIEIAHSTKRFGVDFKVWISDLRFQISDYRSIDFELTADG